MTATRFDVIRAVEACYAGADGDRRWLERLLQPLAPLDGGAGQFAFILDVKEGGEPFIDCEAGSGVLSGVRARMGRLLSNAASAEVLHRFFAPHPPVAYALRNFSLSIPGVVGSARSLFRHNGVEDVLGVCAAASGRRVVLALGETGARGHLPPRTLHQLTMLTAHLVSAMRLRRALPGSPVPPSGAALEAVLDPGGRLLDARGAARSRPAREGLAEAVRRMDRARGALRRADPEEALRLWKGSSTAPGRSSTSATRTDGATCWRGGTHPA